MGEDYNGDGVATLSIGRGLYTSGGIIGQLSVCGPYRGIMRGPYRGIIGQLSVPSAFNAAMKPVKVFKVSSTLKASFLGSVHSLMDLV